MRLDSLLQSLGDDAPSGEDLEYDPSFIELEISAQPGEERQLGNEIVQGEDPDYKDVAAKAIGVLERSHDLRAAIYLAEAQLRMKGLPGFAEVTSYLNRCLDEYWDTCHPQLDADDDNDPTMRVNAILALTDSNRILRGVRRAPLTKSRTFGAFSLRDISVAEGEIAHPADMDGAPDSASIAAAFQDTDPETLAELATAASSALADVRAISEKFDVETPGRGPDLDPLIKLLRQASTRLSAAAGSPDEADAEDEAEYASPGDAAVASPAPQGGAVGGINSPNDVRNALDRIIAYYERSEPSSPVPVLLRRAKKLVGADFLSIVQDMAPNGIDNVYLIGGLKYDETE